MLASPTGRKAEHLRTAAGPGTQHDAGSALERVRLRHRALPRRDLEDVDLTTDLLGARLAAPLVVSAMTGGTPDAGLARPLLIAAQQDRAGEFVGVLVRQLRIATWAAGAARRADLGAEHLR